MLKLSFGVLGLFRSAGGGYQPFPRLLSFLPLAFRAALLEHVLLFQGIHKLLTVGFYSTRNILSYSCLSGRSWVSLLPCFYCHHLYFQGLPLSFSNKTADAITRAWNASHPTRKGVACVGLFLGSFMTSHLDNVSANFRPNYCLGMNFAKLKSVVARFWRCREELWPLLRGCGEVTPPVFPAVSLPGSRGGKWE